MAKATADDQANVSNSYSSGIVRKRKKYDIWYHVLRDDRIFQGELLIMQLACIISLMSNID